MVAGHLYICYVGIHHTVSVIHSMVTGHLYICYVGIHHTVSVIHSMVAGHLYMLCRHTLQFLSYTVWSLDICICYVGIRYTVSVIHSMVAEHLYICYVGIHHSFCHTQYNTFYVIFTYN